MTAFAAAFVVVVFGVGVPSAALHVASHAGITVVFTPDDMGFEATSTKDLSNIIVEYCDLENHKHEFSGSITVYNHTETQVILGVWVKSGNNGIPGGIPSGAGERFDNAGVDCDIQTTTPSTTPPTTTTEIPFFPSTLALGLGAIGALGGALLVFRRRN